MVVVVVGMTSVGWWWGGESTGLRVGQGRRQDGPFAGWSKNIRKVSANGNARRRKERRVTK